MWKGAQVNSCDSGRSQRESKLQDESLGGWGYGVSSVVVYALTEAEGAVKRGETEQVGVVVRDLGRRGKKCGPSEQQEGGRG